MKQALWVDCCIRAEQSRTKRLAEAFFAHLRPEYELTHLDLPALAPRYFSGEYFWERERLLQANDRSHPRFALARQFAAADLIVISAPFWDLSFPALLKVYIEQVSLDGITFTTGQEGLVGLCRASHMVYLTTRGGFYENSDMEMGSRYLHAMQQFFGIGAYTCIAADGMDVVGFDGEKSLRDAMEKASRLAQSIG